jgi:hypothetical protein
MLPTDAIALIALIWAVYGLFAWYSDVVIIAKYAALMAAIFGSVSVLARFL